MKLSLRERYNQSFSTEKYQAFLQDIHSQFDHVPNFRIAETPVFIPEDLRHKLFDACLKISEEICRPDFKEKTEGALSDAYRVPNEDGHTHFLQMDFGITYNDQGELMPMLIEAQGFPSLYLYQDLVAGLYKKHFDIPDHCSHLVDHTSESYIDLLRSMIVGDCNPRNVVLLEIEPDKQTTRIDFMATERMLGIKVLCISELKRDGRDLYYRDESGKKVPVYRIYNRVIFDELLRRQDVLSEFIFTEEIEAQWVGHPNWFFRISKYSLPLFDNPYVPRTWFLKDLSKMPDDLENYVLKPMFSFSGAGVVFHVDRDTIDQTADPANYILQKKITYEPVIQTPNEPVKCEIRMLMLWPEEDEKPTIVNNLVRLSKGEMIGVKYNRDKDWVGGSVGFFTGLNH